MTLDPALQSLTWESRNIEAAQSAIRSIADRPCSLDQATRIFLDAAQHSFGLRARPEHLGTTLRERLTIFARSCRTPIGPAKRCMLADLFGELLEKTNIFAFRQERLEGKYFSKHRSRNNVEIAQTTSIRRADGELIDADPQLVQLAAKRLKERFERVTPKPLNVEKPLLRVDERKERQLASLASKTLNVAQPLVVTVTPESSKSRLSPYGEVNFDDEPTSNPRDSTSLVLDDCDLTPTVSDDDEEAGWEMAQAYDDVIADVEDSLFRSLIGEVVFELNGIERKRWMRRALPWAPINALSIKSQRPATVNRAIQGLYQQWREVPIPAISSREEYETAAFSQSYVYSSYSFSLRHFVEKRLLPQNLLHLLDVGSAPGLMATRLHMLFPQKVFASVLDPRENIPYFPEKSYVRGNPEFLEQCAGLRPDGYDVISVYDVIMATFRDPAGFIARAYDKLKPSGWLLMNTVPLTGLAGRGQDLLSWWNQQGYRCYGECPPAADSAFFSFLAFQKTAERPHLIFPIIYRTELFNGSWAQYNPLPCLTPVSQPSAPLNQEEFALFFGL